MTEVVDMQEYAARRAVQRCRKVWAAHFEDPLDEETMLGDLSHKAIAILARPEPESLTLLHGLVMAARGLGPADQFDSLQALDKLAVLDAALFLADQVRWEVMRRLNWIEGFAGEKHPLIELILHDERLKSEFRPKSPELKSGHPRRAEFTKRRGFDGEALLRSMIPEAVEVFRRKFHIRS